MDKTTDNNVIELRLKANLAKEATLSTQSKKFHSVVASGALTMLLVIVTAANFMLMSQSETPRQSRGIASVDSSVDSRLSQWNQKVLRKISEKSERKIASISSAATDIDQLRFGVLEGKYALVMEDNKIAEIAYQEVPSNEDRPKYLASKEEFLKQNRALIKGDFVVASRLGDKVEDGKIIETFQLLGPQSSPIGKAKFTSDQYGRLLSFKVE